MKFLAHHSGACRCEKLVPDSSMVFLRGYVVKRLLPPPVYGTV